MKWIDVNERLPEEGQRVLLVLESTEELYLGWLYSVKDREFNLESKTGWVEDIYDVTHWMPLPEPPTP